MTVTQLILLTYSRATESVTHYCIIPELVTHFHSSDMAVFDCRFVHSCLMSHFHADN